ncbi:MAG TPA: MATE family efflux transporter [Treponema sp.]|nr:MATE family efflux transporter [Treponema sp.]
MYKDQKIKSKAKQNLFKDMTEGDPLKLIFQFSLPLIFGNLIQQFYSFADAIIVGRLISSNALAAVGTTGPMSFLVFGFVYGLSSGFAVIIAQRFGAKDEQGLKESFAINIKLNFLSALFFTSLSLLLAKPLLRAINTPQEIFADALTYILIMFIGIFFIVVYNAGACILRALGDSKSPLYFLIVASVLNVILDIVFILVFNWGVAGAAWATVISEGISGLLCVVHIIRKFPILHLKKRDFRRNSHFTFQHLKIGLPMAFQFSITAIGVIFLQGALNLFGANHIAGYTAAQKVEHLMGVGAGTFGTTMANYTGQNLGARRVDRIKEGVRKGSFLTLIFSSIGMLIALLFANQLTSLFIDVSTPNGQIALEASKTYIYWSAPFYPVLFMIFIYRNTLQSMGRGFMPLMAGFGELIARIIATYSFPLFFGYVGIVLAGPFAWFAALIPLAIAYFWTIPREHLYLDPLP